MLICHCMGLHSQHIRLEPMHQQTSSCPQPAYHCFSLQQQSMAAATPNRAQISQQTTVSAMLKPGSSLLSDLWSIGCGCSYGLLLLAFWGRGELDDHCYVGLIAVHLQLFSALAQVLDWFKLEPGQPRCPFLLSRAQSAGWRWPCLLARQQA